MKQDAPDIIEVGPTKRRRWRIWLLGVIVVIFIATSRLLAVYVSALWFGSLGFSSVYWYIFKLKTGLFIVATLLTALLLSVTFWLFQRLFGSNAFEQRTILLNNRPVQFSPAKIIRPLGWVLSVIFGLIFGLTIKDDGQRFALYWNQPQTSAADPLFGKTLGFYLFSLPFYEAISGWLLGVTFIILCAALAYSLLGLPQKVLKPTIRWSSGAAFRGVCRAR